MLSLETVVLSNLAFKLALDNKLATSLFDNLAVKSLGGSDCDLFGG
jgi:hypothetical protein